ncbi:hypothetical protein EJB05_27694 [Eragrostis curvula]|uniref:Uncharacterized protein n=1 Tax=Eragrostis curvula TaxID=38414 RepID=A0A5J9UNR4_9POAL|nr:hypothetical protein EJB05_27694 [Eragrostis curvula]
MARPPHPRSRHRRLAYSGLLLGDARESGRLPLDTHDASRLPVNTHDVGHRKSVMRKRVKKVDLLAVFFQAGPMKERKCKIGFGNTSSSSVSTVDQTQNESW